MCVGKNYTYILTIGIQNIAKSSQRKLASGSTRLPSTLEPRKLQYSTATYSRVSRYPRRCRHRNQALERDRERKSPGPRRDKPPPSLQLPLSGAGPFPATMNNNRTQPQYKRTKETHKKGCEYCSHPYLASGIERERDIISTQYSYDLRVLPPPPASKKVGKGFKERKTDQAGILLRSQGYIHIYYYTQFLTPFPWSYTGEGEGAVEGRCMILFLSPSPQCTSASSLLPLSQDQGWTGWIPAAPHRAYQTGAQVRTCVWSRPWAGWVLPLSEARCVSLYLGK